MGKLGVEAEFFGGFVEGGGDVGVEVVARLEELLEPDEMGDEFGASEEGQGALIGLVGILCWVRLDEG